MYVMELKLVPPPGGGGGKFYFHDVHSIFFVSVLNRTCLFKPEQNKSKKRGGGCGRGVRGDKCVFETLKKGKQIGDRSPFFAYKKSGMIHVF